MGRLVEIAPSPGIVKDITTNTATGQWVDADHVRFRQGFPEKIGGWVRATTAVFVGLCRSIFTWVTLADDILTAIGTSKKFYVEESQTLTDVTPIRRSVTLGVDPLQSLSAGSGVIIVTDGTHGAAVGDYVTFSGATAFDGLTTGNLNKEHIVTVVTSASIYRVDTGGSASAGSVNGGGAAVAAAYQIAVGSDYGSYGSGWGAGTWGRSTFSSPSATTTVSAALRRWTQSNWGEDLLFAPRYGEIYRYDSSAGTRGVAISSEGGADNVPIIVTEIIVASRERIVIALGVNELGSSSQDELLIRWSDFENYLEWNPASTNSSGGMRLTHGSQIVTGIEGAGEIIIWTDTALFSMPFVGGNDVFSLSLITQNSSIIGPAARTNFLGVTFWMGHRGFYAYDGRVSRLPCPVEDYVFNDLSIDNSAKVVCGSNVRFNEVWWVYPSFAATEPDKYVAFNVADNTWTIGTLSRTAWLDRSVGFDFPRAAAEDGYLYVHEFGLDDGSTNPVTAISAYIETAPVELGPNEAMGRGDRFAFVNRLIPDVTFRASTGTPTLTYVFKQRPYPGAAYESESANVLMTTTVDRYTHKKSIRLRARAIAMRIESNEVGADFRLGTQRFESRTDGRKQ